MLINAEAFADEIARQFLAINQLSTVSPESGELSP
jgi:hypothetical protein